MISIKDIKNIKGQRVLVRVDYNVPIIKDKVVDDFRIKKTFQTLNYLQRAGAKTILISHIGDEAEQSLSPIADVLKKNYKNFRFIDSPILSEETESQINNLKNGEIVLLENLRFESGEKKNSPSFARALSRYADIFVNDAFSVCHRAHASVVGITKYLAGYAGLLLISEIENLSKAFSPKHPFLFILGGAKFETKIPLIKKFLKNSDNIFIGGALANNFFQVKGYEIGLSKHDDHNFEIPKLLKNSKIIIPKDVCAYDGQNARFPKPDQVNLNENIVDIGPETVKELTELIKKSKFILWNGPLGMYEKGFDKTTKKILTTIVDNKIECLIGGGDTVAVISKMKIEDKIGFVSTGGGATLEFLTKGTLPGIKVLK
jgi:phosphoglycerate kinase